MLVVRKYVSVFGVFRCVCGCVHTFTSFQTSLRNNPIEPCWATITGFSYQSSCHLLAYTIKLFSNFIYIKRLKIKIIRAYHQLIHVVTWDIRRKKMRVVQRKAFNYWWSSFHRMKTICLGMIVFLRTENHTSSISLCKLWSNRKDDK